MEDLIRSSIRESIAAKEYLNGQVNSLGLAAEKIIECFNSGNKVLVFGNGGSAADAQHISSEF